MDFIYRLYELESNTTFYIGRTIDPQRRIAEHRGGSRNCRADSEDKYKYASALDAIGIKWDLEIIYECGPNTEFYEDYFVNKYKLKGEPIQNMKAGDDEVWNGRNYLDPYMYILARKNHLEMAKNTTSKSKLVKRASDPTLTRYMGDFKTPHRESKALQEIRNRLANR